MMSEDSCEPDGSRSEARTDRNFSDRALGSPEKSSTIWQHRKRRNANRDHRSVCNLRCLTNCQIGRTPARILKRELCPTLVLLEDDSNQWLAFDDGSQAATRSSQSRSHRNIRFLTGQWPAESIRRIKCRRAVLKEWSRPE
jgi:hypothetical protein